MTFSKRACAVSELGTTQQRALQVAQLVLSSPRRSVLLVSALT